MKNHNYGVVRIRERGQLTIPEQLRNNIKWLVPNSAVTIYIESENDIRIAPYTTNIDSKSHSTDWELIWNLIRLVRSFSSGQGNLSDFIVEDRGKH